jgi:tripartite-type tricarboxylate transporter receptor subunit TctC
MPKRQRNAWEDMMSRITRRSFVASTAATGASLGLGARVVRAQDYPNRTIRFIVPLAPGGAIDFIARQVGDVLTRSFGQQVVVENRTGAGGTVGMDAALKSPPDGYTVLITNDNAASAPHIMHLSYDYTKELLPICYIGRQPQILAAHSSLSVNTLRELVAYVNANPGLGVERRASDRTSTYWRSGSSAKRTSSSTMCPIAAPVRRSTI